ncbi:MAG: amidohydrolase [Gammaproteobacteria bacterium]|nr:amidohydrolase [Gammaproteobacteria bacterium]MDD9895842.1 amidohydrolase [Gammaproteobacteria bacterium]MDD9958941.1 amidohydrolase [Gammaproteobacteria bacterium]
MSHFKGIGICIAVAMFSASALHAQDHKATVMQYIDDNAALYGDVAQQIWDWAEVGYLETQSANLLQQQLANAGFEITTGVAGIPTAFVATYSAGSGGPTVGILAEYDALPGITQDRNPLRDAIDHKAAGHACGHHLFGTGSVAAAIATKMWMQETGQVGEIRLYGTPAEEGGAGKVYMVRDGLFEDVDIVLHWHPSDSNSADARSSLANKSAKFRFAGLSAHAAGAPHRGRSALDGVEAMNHMVNLMREHVPMESRIHYVITAGGSAPNVVPDFSEVYYYVRHPDPSQVNEIFERVVQAAKGAALGTETEMDYEVIHGIYNVLPNISLQEAIHSNLSRVGGVDYDAEERQFAETLRTALPSDAPPIMAASNIRPMVVSERGGGGSTDVADVSWAVATGGMRAATWVPGTSSHSWQAVAAGGTSIGNKGMIVAAKTLAMTAVDLITNESLVESAKNEHQNRLPVDWEYEPLLGDRPPPLDYRLPAGPGN